MDKAEAKIRESIIGCPNESAEAQFAESMIDFLKEQEKISEEMILKYKNTGAPMLSPASGEFLDRLAEQCEIKRNNGETDKHLKRRVSNKILAMTEGGPDFGFDPTK